jgi:hypothetical protein
MISSVRDRVDPIRAVLMRDDPAIALIQVALGTAVGHRRTARLPQGPPHRADAHRIAS